MAHLGVSRAGQGLAVAGALLFLAGAVVRAEPVKRPQPETARPVQLLAGKIDQHFAGLWKDNQVQPAPAADDAEFLRRVFLDLAGRIPSAGEARRFLEEKGPDRRQRLVEDLLNSPSWTAHRVNVWRELLLPELKTRPASQGFFYVSGTYALEAWLRKQFEENVGYDRLVRELLTAPVDNLSAAGDDVYGAGSTRPSPHAFYALKKVQPDSLAASTSRLFLGVRLECAQCHNHPFAQWKREQFWNQAAFFAGLEAPGNQPGLRPFRDNPGIREIAMPDAGKMVPARFLDGTEPKWQDKVSSRKTFADWLTAPDNPYFARAAANRLWASLLGAGLIEPVDEMVGDAAQGAEHSALLDELAKAFIEQGFDQKFLMRAITASKVYQLGSARTHSSQDDPRLFARMPLRGLTAEQLFESLALATGYQRPNQPQIGVPGLVVGADSAAPPGVPPQDLFRERFLARFASASEKATEAQTSIQQALALMNGEFVAGAHSVRKCRTLSALVDFPLMTTAERVEALYLATLSRKPRPAESERLVKYVERGGALADGQEPGEKDRTTALADVLWMLLNSAEFKLNH
jgi:hypothetical protein